MKTINVTARKWSGGWELKLDDNNITQVRALSGAEQQVRDYLDTLDPATSHDNWAISVALDIGVLADDVREAKAETAKAAQLQRDAALRTRRVVHDLRERNFSVSDIATILNISRGRVSQLQSADSTETMRLGS